jgi:hypothetical protein
VTQSPFEARCHRAPTIQRSLAPVALIESAQGQTRRDITATLSYVLLPTACSDLYAVAGRKAAASLIPRHAAAVDRSVSERNCALVASIG